MRRGLWGLLALATLSTLAEMPDTVEVTAGGSTSRPNVKLIDSHLHIWSDGTDPYPWAVEPPEQLQKAATTEQLRIKAREAGVTGALIIQPANHKFDHSYVIEAMRSDWEFYRGVALVDGSLPPLEAVESVEKMWDQGFVGVRFNPALFPQGIDGPTGLAVFKRCGEMQMPVGVMTFGGLLPHVAALRALVKHWRHTTLIIDHCGFFRQPATGGLLGTAAENDEAAWQALLALAELPSVHVKLSAFFRTSATKPPHADLAPRLAELLRAFGAQRILWGSDFPFVLTGGNDPASSASSACSYKDAVAQVATWGNVPGLDDEAYKAIMGGNAMRLFGFWPDP